MVHGPLWIVWLYQLTYLLTYYSCPRFVCSSDQMIELSLWRQSSSTLFDISALAVDESTSLSFFSISHVSHYIAKRSLRPISSYNIRPQSRKLRRGNWSFTLPSLPLVVPVPSLVKEEGSAFVTSWVQFLPCSVVLRMISVGLWSGLCLSGGHLVCPFPEIYSTSVYEG